MMEAIGSLHSIAREFLNWHVCVQKSQNYVYKSRGKQVVLMNMTLIELWVAFPLSTPFSLTYNATLDNSHLILMPSPRVSRFSGMRQLMRRWQ